LKQEKIENKGDWQNPNPTVDIAITDGNRVVLVQRANEPFKGQWVFPGGFVEYNERVEDTAIREAKEETSLDIELVDILGVYSDPGRDPRAHNISTVFVGRKLEGEVMGGDDAAAAEWRDLEDLMPDDLAFDHGLILQDLKSWLRNSSMTYWSARER
jgi:ADP-ribose pyrophosphatase YjhB (NUDIX family)